jgi:hypothetical protein
MTLVIAGYDITAANYSHRPNTGQICLYTTGGAGIQATQEMLNENPDAVRIAQHPGDTTADVYDVERGAITLAELPGLIKEALINWRTGTRVGQRTPLVYASDSMLPDVQMTLSKASLSNFGVGMFPAHWGVSVTAATARINTDHGMWPEHAFQYENDPYFDLDLFSVDWLESARKYHHSWTDRGQRWTLVQLAGNLGIQVSALIPGNAQAQHAVNEHARGNEIIIPIGAHFTYKRM